MHKKRRISSCSSSSNSVLDNHHSANMVRPSSVSDDDGDEAVPSISTNLFHRNDPHNFYESLDYDEDTTHEDDTSHTKEGSGSSHSKRVKKPFEGINKNQEKEEEQNNQKKNFIIKRHPKVEPRKIRLRIPFLNFEFLNARRQNLL